MRTKPLLTIIRGIPGSGKSTEARKHMGVLLEADMYHIDENGEYNWQAKNAGKAHKWCQDRAKSLLDSGFDVIVANTFTTLKELRPYIEWGYEVKFVDCEGGYQNIHNVPEETLEKMRARWISSSDIRFIQYVQEWRVS